VKQQAEWTKQHELTPEQFKQLIQNKIKRVAFYYRAKVKPERDFSVTR
jgi:GH35 family endo-1,4-beta-xylanase